MKLWPLVVLAALVSGCTNGDSTPASTIAATLPPTTLEGNAVAKTEPTTPATTSTTTTTSVAPRPPGPAADISEVLAGGNGVFLASGATASHPGYLEEEYVAAGTATSFSAVDGLAFDGQWTFVPDTTAPYRTRIVIRRPERAADFSGTVVLEWLNVSAGLDANPEYTNLEEEIVRKGDIWIGISAQAIGVVGGSVLVSAPSSEGVAGKGLRALDPARYGSLQHPGDGFSFDIFTQVSRALRSDPPALGGLTPQRIIAAGASQSAFALTTYYNGVQPISEAFDGFLIHSRAAFVLPLVAPGETADLAAAIGLRTTATFRTDLTAPVLELQSESDVTGLLQSVLVRQPDSDRFRLWEVAGTAHADAHLVGNVGTAFDCGAPINNGPMHLVAKAALRSLVAWVHDGTLPPTATRLEVTPDSSAIVRNEDGIAEGGIRTPLVDVPVDLLSGNPGPGGSLLCLLLGSTIALPDARLAELHPSRDLYSQRFADAADATIAAGFVLEDDRDALIAFSQPVRITG